MGSAVRPARRSSLSGVIRGASPAIRAPTVETAVVGISATNHTFAHTPETVWTLKAGTGAGLFRVLGSAGSDVQAPYLWSSGPFPPAAGSESNVLFSADGQDVFVETDCGATGDCNAGGDQTHTMIYNGAMCGGPDPWFDVATGRCRGDTIDPVQNTLDDHETRITDNETGIADHETRITDLEARVEALEMLHP